MNGTILLFTVIPLELKALLLLKWNDEKGIEQKFRLVEKVSSKWSYFAVFLLGQGAKEALEGDVRLRNAGERWIEAMKKWLEIGGTMEYSTTWEGLCKLLEDLEYRTYADDRATGCFILLPSLLTRLQIYVSLRLLIVAYSFVCFSVP